MSKSVKWSPYQKAVFVAVETTDCSYIVEAVAGSGKSTTIVEACKRLAGKRVFLAAFNKKIADELKGKVACLEGVDAGTFHSIGFSAVRYANKNTRVDDRKVHRLVDELIPFGSDLFGFREFVRRAVAMAKQCAIGAPGGDRIDYYPAWDEMVWHYGIDDVLPDGASDREVKQALRMAMAVLKANNAQTDIVDFNDMVYLPLALRLRPRTFDVVFIDEAQDVNKSRLLLAEKMLAPGGRIIAVGDPRQAIYGFSGAMSDSLAQIKNRFNAQSLPLSVNYRCGKVIIQAAQEYCPELQAHDGAPMGSLGCMGGDEFNTLDLLPTDAILCRVNKPLVELCFSLIRRGIPAKIEGRDIGQGLVNLCNRWKVKTLDALTKRLETYRANETAKAKAKDDEAKAQSVLDRVETLLVLIDRAREKHLDKQGLITMIEDMFADGVGSKGILTLCSVHKSKGLEWDRVFILDRSRHMPAKWAKKPWELEQERNLVYVAMTRAKSTLIDVDMEMETLALAA